MKRILEIGGVVAGVVLIAFGAFAVLKSIDGRNTVSNELAAQKITGTADMTPSGIKKEVAGQSWAKNISLPTCNVANQPINSGDRARCFAQYMRIHALEATGGYVYSEMGIYQALPTTPKNELKPGGGTDNTLYAATDPKTGQPVQNGPRNVWVTETALTTALNASYMADQLGLFGLMVGAALLLSGFGFIILALGGALENQWAFAKKPAAEMTSDAKATPLSV